MQVHGLGTVALTAAALAAAPLPWLPEVRQAPPGAPAAPAAWDLLAGRPHDREQWLERRGAIRRWWLDFLGPAPEPPADLKPRVIEEDRAGDVLRQLVRLQVEPGCWMEVYLLRPAMLDRRVPGVVVLHSTVDYTIRQPAGLEGPASHHIGLHLALRGFVTVCPRCFIWDYTGATTFGDAVARLRERHPGWRGMGKMLYDAQRAADYLQGLGFVDPGRLGCIGHSLGAKETLFLCALDDRFSAAVSSEGGVGLSFSNWDAEWYLGPAIREPDFAHDTHELLALAAPRPFLLIGGGSADGAQSWPFVAAAMPVYRLMGGAEALGLLVHDAGHSLPPIALERAYEWLEHHLGVARAA